MGAVVGRGQRRDLPAAARPQAARRGGARQPRQGAHRRRGADLVPALAAGRWPGGRGVRGRRAASSRCPSELPSGLAVRSFTREVDVAWRRTSYSGLTRAADQQPGGVASEPEDAGLEDEAVEPRADDPRGAGRRTRCPRRWRTCPPAPPSGRWCTRCSRRPTRTPPTCAPSWRPGPASSWRWWPVDVDADDLAEAMLPLHATPLGPLAPGLTLGDIALRDRLRELDFEIPLAGGDRGRRGRRTPGRGGAAAAQAPAADDPLLAYADRLEQPLLGGQSLRGYLSGSIDVVLRVPGGDGAVRRRRLQDQPARRPRAAADRRRTTAPTSWPRRCCTPTTRCRRCSTPWSCTATCAGGCRRTTRRPTSVASSTSTCAACAARDTPLTDGHPAGVFSWPVPPALVPRRAPRSAPVRLWRRDG